MTHNVTEKIDVESLERHLKQQTEPHQRLVTIDKLLEPYIYTNPRRALELLKEQENLLCVAPNEDFIFNFWYFSATVANSLYRFKDAMKAWEKVIELVEKQGDFSQRIDVYIDYTGTLLNLECKEETDKFLKEASDLLVSYPDPKLKARLITRQGYLQLHYEDLSGAIEKLLEAEKQLTRTGLQLELKDYYFLSLIYSGLGAIYGKNEDIERSVQAFLKVIEMAKMTGIRSRLSWQYLNVGNSYLAINQLEEAEYYFRKALENDGDVDAYSRASIYANLGYCLLEKEEYEKALELLDEAEALYKQIPKEKARHNFSQISTWRSEVYAALENEDKVYENLLSALEYAKESKSTKQLSMVYKAIATFFANQKDYKSAYEFQLLHTKYSEAYEVEVNERKRTELEVKYDAEKKKQEAELFRLQATKLQMKALRAQMNPHFLYNALNSIQHYITSQNATSAAKYLAKFAKLMRQSLEYSDLETISLEKEIDFLEDYLYINEKLRFKNKLTYQISVDDDLEEDILGVPTMIVQPYVENALEHGLRSIENGRLQLTFKWFDEQTILCVIEDNGVGRDKAREMQLQDARYQNHKSRGTMITEERLELLHSSSDHKHFVHIEDLKDPLTKEAAGTRVEIKIPVVDLHRR